MATNLIYRTSKTVGKELIKVTVSLDDKCKNGHQDFSVTGKIFIAGKPHTDRNMIACGCIHDDIAKNFPDLIPFIRLHLCDYDGVPMHPIANGYYHLTQGFNQIKPESPEFQAKYCEYYRITPDQFKALAESKSQLNFAVNLEKLGVLARWKEEAKGAIAQLEALTGQKFENNSTRSQFVPLTEAERAEEDARQQNGYYTPEAEAAREAAKFEAIKAKLRSEADKAIAKAETEYIVKLEVLTKGGSQALENCIFYNHSNTLSFNWRGYDNLPADFLNDLIHALVLPDGVKAEIEKDK